MKLLLAEDEKSLSRAIKIILEKNNYLVDAVYDGREALEYLEADFYDGAVLDIMMPKMDGIEVLRRIREEGNTVPVLLLTAKSQIEDKVLGLDTGANDYLTKPFDKEELLARIRAMTRVRQSQGSSVLSYGDITLNLASCELASPKGSFRLAGKEFGMMELLMRDPGTLISAEIFLELISLSDQLQCFLLGILVDCAVFLHLSDLSESFDSLADSLVVCEHSAQPSLVYIEHSASLSLILDGSLSLLLCSYEQNRLAGLSDLSHEIICVIDKSQRLLKVDDIDSVSLCEDIRSHLRVPSSCLMSEMDACFEQLFH